MLEEVRAEFGRAGTIVTFNGKSFDAPVLETRYLFQRLDWPDPSLRHLDILHPARRFWGRTPPRRLDRSGTDWQRSVLEESDCSLAGLEKRVLGMHRRGDVPGLEIPSRYFEFVRSRDPQVLVGVLEHNRLDLLSLAGMTARLLRLLGGGADEALDGREALALGKLYARAGDDARAREAFKKALDSKDGGLVVAEASRALALMERRARRYDCAAAHWRRVLDCPGCPGLMVREATDALAIHHEHRLRDLEAARAFALRSANSGAQAGRSAAARHRLERIDRKLAAARPLLT